MEFTIFRKDYHPLLVESLVKVMLLYFEKQKQLLKQVVTSTASYKKSSQKKFFLLRPQKGLEMCV